MPSGGGHVKTERLLCNRAHDAKVGAMRPVAVREAATARRRCRGMLVMLLLAASAAAAAFDELVVDAAQLARHPVSSESRFAGTDWQGTEGVTMEQADRVIGRSTARRPVGSIGR